MSADDILRARWHDVEAVLSGALERPPAERRGFVERRTIGDDDLRDLVLRLLDRVSAGGARLTTPSGHLVEAAFGEAPAEVAEADLAPGSAIGRYVIVRRRARGGMATVYEAERADGAYRQRVALKLLRRGLDTGDLVRRFLTERQVLSSLTHPNIARLLDGGSTPEGRPYLVMELVAGEPVTAYSDARRLDVAARLDLFLQLADAVHAAHRQLVVHRDIKPSNVFVNADGTVKLLDFGIAKLLADDAEHTNVGARALTPEYASPELLRGERVTTASDVFQLGLLLRELVTGLRPSAADDEPGQSNQRASRLARTWRENAPTVEERAAARGATPARLARRLAGDLDVIIDNTLREAPERRYSSVDELASDIRRHLRGLPITAHPESRIYRLRKLVRRNPWAAATVASALVALVGYAFTLTLQRERIATERDRAEQESAKTERVTHFLLELFQSADPDEAGGDVTARALLDRGAAQIERTLGDEPAVRAAMLAAIGQSYFHLGLHVQARDLLERAVAQLRASGDSTSRAMATDLDLLAVVVVKSDRPRAMGLFREALAIAERSLGGNDPLVGRILADYGTSYVPRGSDDTTGRIMEARALRILRAAPGDHRAELASALDAAAYGRGADVGLPLMREALALRRSLYGEMNTATAFALSDLALATEKVDAMAADSLMQHALEILETVHGRRHASTLGVLNNLAGLRRDRGAYAEAATLYREVLAMRRELYPDEHVGHAYTLYGLGLSLAESGKPVEGESDLRQALGILRRETPTSEVLIQLTRAAIGYAEARQRRFREAEPVLTDAYRRLRTARVEAISLEGTLRRLIWMYDTWGRAQDALTYKQQLDSLESADRQGTGTS